MVVKGSRLSNLLRTTDHKTIGLMYLATSFAFFLIGGLMAMLMRGELARPGLQFLSPEQYNQLFTMHGTLMLLMFATPLFFAFGEPDHAAADRRARRRLPAAERLLVLAVPLRRPDRAVRASSPRAARPTSAGPPTRRCPTVTHSPGAGGNLWIAGLAVGGLGTILGGVNFITTIVCLRAPGMTHVPDADLHLERAGHQRADPAGVPDPDRRAVRPAGRPQPRRPRLLEENGGPMLWQHLFWFFGHPEVYIIALPFFGIITEIIPVFSRKPLFGYKGMVGATLAIGALSLAVWAHHMYATGAVLLPFFAFLTYLIAVPTGIKFFNWIGTMWRGPADLRDADALLDRLHGHLPARRPDRRAAGQPAAGLARHRHLLRRRPLPLRRLRHRGVRRLRRHLLLVPEDVRPDDGRAAGQAALLADLHRLPRTFLVQHWLGNEGMPRRYADYLPTDRFTTLNMVSTIGSFILGASTIPFLYNVVKSWSTAEAGPARRPVGSRQLAGVGDVVPAAAAQLRRDPRIRSERPAFEAHYPHLVQRLQAEAHAGRAAQALRAEARCTAGRRQGGGPERPRCPSRDARGGTRCRSTRPARGGPSPRALLTVSGADRPGRHGPAVLGARRHGRRRPAVRWSTSSRWSSTATSCSGSSSRAAGRRRRPRTSRELLAHGCASGRRGVAAATGVDVAVESAPTPNRSTSRPAGRTT